MTEQTPNDRSPVNKLNAAEMFKLTTEVEKRATSGESDPSPSWRAAEEVFSALLGRPVTRPNILTALGSLDGIDQSQVVRPRNGSPVAGDLDSKIERLDGRLERLATEARTYDRQYAAQFVRLDELTHKTAGRVDAIDEVLAREAARIDTAESNREAVRELVTRHTTEIEQLKQQNAVLLARLEAVEATVEKPFALNSGGDFAEGLPPGGPRS